MLQISQPRRLTKRFQVVLRGFFNGPVELQSAAGVVVGAGYFYQLSSRWMVFNSYTSGLDKASPGFLAQLGLAVAL